MFRVPDNESQTIHPIQQLPGSALTVLEIQRTDNAQSVAVIVVGEAIGIYADLVTADGNENFVDTSVNILKDINKKTDAYRSMLPQLGILGSGIAEHVIRFYAGVELLASSAQSVPPDNAPKRRIADMSLLEQTFAFEALFCLARAEDLARDARIMIDHLCIQFHVRRPTFDGVELRPTAGDMAHKASTTPKKGETEGNNPSLT